MTADGWWPGNERSQGVGRKSIGIVFTKYSGFGTSSVNRHVETTAFNHAKNCMLVSDEMICARDDSRLAPSRRETSPQCNAVSHWLSANLESVSISKAPFLGIIIAYANACQRDWHLVHSIMGNIFVAMSSCLPSERIPIPNVISMLQMINVYAIWCLLKHIQHDNG